jgi:hypothetical protein
MARVPALMLQEALNDVCLSWASTTPNSPELLQSKVGLTICTVSPNRL